MSPIQKNMEVGLAVEARFARNNKLLLEAALSPYRGYEDVHDTAEAQAKGFDFNMAPLMNQWGPQQLALGELKADTYATGNMVLEVISRAHYGTKKKLVPGYALSSQADWLFYGFEPSREVLVVPMADLLAWARQAIATFDRVTPKDNKDSAYVSFSYLIPVATILQKVSSAKWIKLGPAPIRTVSPVARPYDAVESIGSWIDEHPTGFPRDLPDEPPSLLSVDGVPFEEAKAYWASEAGQEKLRQILAQLIKIYVKKKEPGLVLKHLSELYLK